MHAVLLPLSLALSLFGCLPMEPNRAYFEGACEQNYGERTGRVVDQAHLLSSGVEARLTAALAELERSTHHQLVVATTPSLHGESIETYALCLANHWGVGRKEADDGVVLLVAPTERRARIEVGLGLGKLLSDKDAARIMERDIIPAFAAGDPVGGIEAGVEAIAREIR